MDNTSNGQFSRSWLESLSTTELVKLAEDFGIDIPPGLERIFIIEELLLESAYLSAPKEEEEIQIIPSYTESVVLPKQYNISFIEVIIRDPLWAYVFWEIKSHDREMHENAADFKGYCIRLIPLIDGEDIQKSKENSFTVSIDKDDNARYLGFAEHSPQTEGRYVIKLSVIRGEAELQIAVSQPFNMPRLIEKNGNFCTDDNPFVRLSGVRDFSTTNSTDRESRVKRQ
ncbi:MAG: DUF4912 domain-containing protein [Treponema sp.]|jgi:hypothetical protein|nr:DUF4912 domain-containing protein [Treponema sp.]